MAKKPSKYANGGDQKMVSKIANEHYGGYAKLLKAHGWKRTSQPIMNDVSTGIIRRYESIERFEDYHSAKPSGNYEEAHDLLDAYDGAWMKGFWGWSPDSWGCVGYPSNGLRDNFFRNPLNTRLMFIYVTQSAGKQDNAPQEQLGRIVGFYELSEMEGHRHKFQESFHHPRKPGSWPFSIKAKRAFTILDKPYPLTHQADPSLQGKSMGAKYGYNSAALSDAAYQFLKSCTYEEVPVFNSTIPQAARISFSVLKSPKHGKTKESKPVKGGASNRSGYYVDPEGDSEKSLYILQLCGDIESYRGKPTGGKKIIKVGLSFSPESRRDFFNRVIPDGQYSWEILKSTQLDKDNLYSCFEVAESGEWAMKEFFHREPKNHLSGEFYMASDSDIEEAWKMGREIALKAEGKANG